MKKLSTLIFTLTVFFASSVFAENENQAPNTKLRCNIKIQNDKAPLKRLKNSEVDFLVDLTRSERKEIYVERVYIKGFKDYKQRVIMFVDDNFRADLKPGTIISSAHTLTEPIIVEHIALTTKNRIIISRAGSKLPITFSRFAGANISSDIYGYANFQDKRGNLVRKPVNAKLKCSTMTEDDLQFVEMSNNRKKKNKTIQE